jgi:hypothetical protein
MDEKTFEIEPFCFSDGSGALSLSHRIENKLFNVDLLGLMESML